MKRKCLYLPHEIWNHIFDKLDESDLEQVSLVCKKFLLIANSLKISLTIFNETLPVLSRVLRRFQHLEKITIFATSRYANLLRQISCSDIHSQGRKKLKTLIFKKTRQLDSRNYTAIANLFPWLEEITIPGSIESPEFKYLQLKLLHLKKISLQRRGPIKESVISLSFNWANLEEIDVAELFNVISEETIGFMMRHCPKLTSLRLPYFIEAPPNCNLSIRNSITFAKNLDTLSFDKDCMSEDHILSFVEAKPPLKKLQIYNSSGMRIEYLMMLLQACSAIQDLDIDYGGWLSDSSIEEISQLLPRLTHIHIETCWKLSIASIFELTKNCPLLECIKFPSMQREAGEVSSTNMQKREIFCHLDLSFNRYLDNKTLSEILWVFPNLQSINLSWCHRITGEAVQQILKTCLSLSKLEIPGLKNVADILQSDFEGRTIVLKILDAGFTGIGDDALFRMGKMCNSLESLNISGCKRVTKTGVMEVLTNCKKLKKINLNGCRNLSINLLVDLAPKSSLKQIDLPDNLFLTEKEKTELWKSGCKICNFWD